MFKSEPDANMRKTPTGPSHVRELDTVRGLAALIVLFPSHLLHHVDPISCGARSPSPLRPFPISVSGVDLFFVLSASSSPRSSSKPRPPRLLSRLLLETRPQVLPLSPLSSSSLLLFVPHFRPIRPSIQPLHRKLRLDLPRRRPPAFWTLAIEEQFSSCGHTVVRKRPSRS